MKTSQDLFKQLDEAESLFTKGSIKDAQKKVREVITKSKELDKVPNTFQRLIKGRLIFHLKPAKVEPCCAFTADCIVRFAQPISKSFRPW